MTGSGGVYLSIGTYVDPSAEGTIEVLPAGVYGNVTPIRKITGTNTLLRNPVAVGIDGAGTIYAFNYWTSSITEYSLTANGNAAPIRIIGGSNTNLFGGYYAMAVCSSGLVYA